MNPILQNTLYFVTGYLELGMLLLVWGFSAGLAAPYPYYALVGSLILILLGSTLALFVENIATAFAIISSTLMLIWPVGGVFSDGGSIQEFAVVALLPGILLIESTSRLIRRRKTSWTQIRSDVSNLKRIVIVTVSMLILFSTINMKLVFLLAFAGPQIE